MKNAVFKIVFLAAIGLTILGCSKAIEDYPKFNLREIAYFAFDYYHNSESNIFIQHVGEIDELNRYITVSVPTDADLTNLRPTIKVSPRTTCTPGPMEVVDFSHGPVEYVATAESGKQAFYTVTVTADYIYDDAIIYRMFLTDIPNPNIDEEEVEELIGDPTTGISAQPTAYFDGSEITIKVPRNMGYDLSHQRTHLDMSPSSHRCTFEISELGDESDYKPFSDNDFVNYTADTVIFKLTTESGRIVRYKTVVREKTEEEEAAL